jgi:transitional endoplasmic reticulum ATPase
MAKAIATSTSATFYSLSGAVVYSAYVGESERLLRHVFDKARATSPSVILLDEVDALVGKRSMSTASSGRGGDSVQERILSTLLNEMDGIATAGHVLVIGATNRPDMLDAALMRPGRFDHQLYASSVVVC